MKCHPYLMNHVTPVQMAERYLHEAQHQKDVSVATSLRTQLQLAQLFWARCEQTTAKHVLKSLIKRCQQVGLRGGVWGWGTVLGEMVTCAAISPCLYVLVHHQAAAFQPRVVCHVIEITPAEKEILTWDS